MTDTDPDLIARLYPFQDRAGTAFALIASEANRSRAYLPLQLDPRERQYGHRERESTEPLEGHEDPEDEACLELRFSHGPRTHHGFVFGCGQDSDVVLPSSVPTISFHHFALTFDSYYRLIVKDLGSRNGIEVTYGKQGKGRRSNFSWIVGGDPYLDDNIEIVIHVASHLKFRVVVPQQDMLSHAYINKVEWFLQGTADAEGLFGQLDLRSRPQTQSASGAHTPGSDPITVSRKVGEGAFGVVFRIWDVGTGTTYALKQPSQKAIRESRVEVRAWQKEARLLEQLSHDHIVKLLGSDFTQVPKLYLEYVPCGALNCYRDLAAEESGQVLCQCLSALVYLHGHNPPILHRDIKPGNILVQSRDSGGILVKFGDFGLSRQSHDPTTMCGTWRYMAPEMHPDSNRRKSRRGPHVSNTGYTTAVDIWSLGVVILELQPRGLPSGNDRELAWREKIVKRAKRDLEKNWDYLGQFLCDFMVIMQPDARTSAQDCCEKASITFGVAEDGCQTPQPLSYASVYDGQEVYGDQQTAFPQDPGNNPPRTAFASNLGNHQRHKSEKAPAPKSSRKRPVSSSGGSGAKTFSSGSGKRPTKRHHESSQWLSEPRISQIAGLWDPLHELGGGSSLAALGSQEDQDASELNDEWSTFRTQTPEQPPVEQFVDGSSRWLNVPDPQSPVHEQLYGLYTADAGRTASAGIEALAPPVVPKVQPADNALTQSEQELVDILLASMENRR